MWTDVQGEKKDNFYITGVSGTPVAAWFRAWCRPHEAPRRISRSFPRSLLILMPKGLHRRW